MKKILIYTALMLTGWSLLAQPNYTTQIYEIEQGRKAPHYLAQANRFQKRGSFDEAIANAAFALSIANNKRQKRRAHDVLREIYNVTIQTNLSKIESLKEQTAVFRDDQTVTKKAEILRIYKTMHGYNLILGNLSKKYFKKVKSKDEPLNLQISDYTTELAESRTALEQAKREAAEMHYQKGIEEAAYDDIAHNKQAYRHFEWAMMYVPGYKDARAKQQKAQKKGTTRMGILRFEDKTGQGNRMGNLAEAVTDEIVSGLFNNAAYRNLKFFELISRDELAKIIEEQKLSVSGLMDESSTVQLGNIQGVQVLLVGKVTTTSVHTNALDPVVRDVAREVVLRKEKYKGEDGKTYERDVEGTVRATYTEFTKEAVAEVNGSFRIVDVETGKILRTETAVGKFYWRDSWGKFRGDRRALNRNQRGLVEKREPAYPSKSSLITKANQNLAEQLVRAIMSYASEVGM